MPMMPKRQFLKAGLAAALPLALWRCAGVPAAVADTTNTPRSALDLLWDQADAIERDLARTSFSRQNFCCL